MRILSILVFGLVLALTPAHANEQSTMPAGPRWGISVALTSWPALGDLEPATGGGFDSLGFGLGAAMHWPFRQFDNSELLVGIDGFIVATDSSINGLIDDVLARHLYLGGSVKWAFGEARNVHLDAGLGFHLADMAEVSTEYLGLEHEAWEEERIGAFVGLTWDAGAQRPGKLGRLSLSLRAHFVDFGSVHDEEVLIGPLFGRNAGQLDGPVYLFEVGLAGR
jgi:hypothetical protein